MRIVVFMARFSPWSQNVAATLASQGHDVHVFDFRHSPDQSLSSPDVPGILADYEKFASVCPGVHLVDAPAVGRARYLWAAPRLRKVSRKVCADVILTLYGGGLALSAWASGFRPYCIYLVGSDVLKAGRLGRRINHTTFTRAARVFANGEYLAAQAIEQAPEATVMPLLIGVDPLVFEQAAPGPGAVQFICTRGFQPVYNNEAIIRAIAKIPPEAGEFRVVFTSGGALLDSCRALADRIVPAPQRGWVHFLGGVSYERLLQELRRSHAILSLSRSDGTATSVLEGMASGLYPILSDIPQNRALIRPGESVGSLVPLDNAPALVDALGDVVRNASTRAKAAQVNRHFVANAANARTNRTVLAGELARVAGNHSGRH
jgi:glycosyltransferase involved in cell wall biosynthesis